MPFSKPIIPERMLTVGREPDPVFHHAEPLYRRCTRHMVHEGRLAPTAIQAPPGIEFPGMSVNRGKYSEPEDVKLANVGDEHWSQWGVAVFVVGYIPTEPPAELKKHLPHAWSWFVEHLPEEENYAHSEMRTKRNGRYDAGIEVPKTIKKWFRLELSKRSRVIIDPAI